MNPDKKLWGNSNGSFQSEMEKIAKYYQDNGEENKPLFFQDGIEIHRELEGITFRFWGTPEKNSKIVVNFEGREDDKTLQLTGGIYENFSEAKEALREKAKEIYSNHSSEDDSDEIINIDQYSKAA